MAGSECADQDGSIRVIEPASTPPGVIQDFVDGYLVPVDPMDGLQCDGCQ